MHRFFASPTVEVSRHAWQVLQEAGGRLGLFELMNAAGIADELQRKSSLTSFGVDGSDASTDVNLQFASPTLMAR